MAKGTFGANITSERIADLGIDSDDIADNAVVGSKILNDAITGAKLADNISITTTGTLDVSGGTFTTSTAQNQAIAASDIALTQTLENKTLTSPVINTGVSGTAFIDDDTLGTATSTNFASSESIKAYVDAQIAANSGGKVIYKGTINSTSLPSGTVPTGKTWIAFGYSQDSSSSFGGVSGYGYGYGYGFGQPIATKTGSNPWTTMVPAGTATYQYYIEMDNG